MKRIAIFASGAGSNAENIINHFENKPEIDVSLILTNNENAFVIQRAKKHKTKCIVFSKDEFFKSDVVIDILIDHKIDLIVLAGFLWLIPSKLINKFPNRIINIHPALLPKFGGKGMYGMKVHQSVCDNKETQSGITIHYVNEHYDSGAIICQEKCEVTKQDTPESIAEKIHHLEYKFFPSTIEKLL